MYAGFIRRCAALFLDSIIVGIIQLILAIPFVIMGSPKWTSTLAYWVLWFFYYVYMEASPWQATLGKRIIGIKVTDLQGNRISLARSFGRRVAEILSYITICIGFLMCIWTKKRQCLHDMLAGCLVVTNEPSPTGDPRPTNPPVWVWLVGLVVPFLFILLITGILTAIALPQYFVAVEKARSAEVYKAMQAIHYSAERTRLRTGKWPSSFKALDTYPAAAEFQPDGKSFYIHSFIFEGKGWNAEAYQPFTVRAKRVDINKQPATGFSVYALSMTIDGRGKATFSCAPEKSSVCRSFNQQMENKK